MSRNTEAKSVVIRLRPETHARLAELKRPGETWGNCIARVISAAKAELEARQRREAALQASLQGFMDDIEQDRAGGRA